jgi:hypothetical protein
VKYEAFADKFEVGDVLLFEGRAWYSALIKQWTLSKFSHAAIMLRIKADGAMIPSVVEAIEPYGIRVYPLKRYMQQCAKRREVVHWYRVTDDNVNREKVVRYALEQWGKRYVSPWQMVLSFGRWARMFMRLFGHATPVNLDPDRFFCSELVASALQFAGYRPDLDEGFSPVTTDPGSIANLPCLQRKGLVRFDESEVIAKD